MQSRTWMWTLALSLFAALAMPVGMAAQSLQQTNQKLPRYTITDLGTLGGTFGAAQGISNNGLVEGYATLPGDQSYHSFVWAGGVKIDLGTLGGSNSGGDFGGDFRPNERGQVPGVGETSVLDPRGIGCYSSFTCLPFIWENGVQTTLPILGGYWGWALAINNRGQATGAAETATADATCPPDFPLNQFSPVIWWKGKIRVLPRIAGDTFAQGNGINDNGQAVGTSGDCVSNNHAVLWQDGMVTDLGNLGGSIGNQAFDINNQGQVVGNAALPDGTIHGFLWQHNVMADIGTLPGYVYSFATGINDKGQVGGTSCAVNHTMCRAFIWQNGVMTDLNLLIYAGSSLTLLQARQINSRGEAAGFAFQASTGEIHAYLATPCNGNHCEKGAEGTAAAVSATSAGLEVTLPENVRNLLRQQLAHRYHIPSQPAAPRD